MNSLPDVSTWLALAYEHHFHHRIAANWFGGIDATQSIQFCRVSQMGFLRLLTQQKVLGTSVQTQREAWRTYFRFREDTRIGFAAEPAAVEEAFVRVSSRDEVSPKLWTDDYLAAFAIATGLTLVTFDRSPAARVPSSRLLTP